MQHGILFIEKSGWNAERLKSRYVESRNGAASTRSKREREREREIGRWRKRKIVSVNSVIWCHLVAKFIILADCANLNNLLCHKIPQTSFAYVMHVIQSLNGMRTLNIDFGQITMYRCHLCSTICRGGWQKTLLAVFPAAFCFRNCNISFYIALRLRNKLEEAIDNRARI